MRVLVPGTIGFRTLQVCGLIWVCLLGTLLAHFLTREEALSAVFPGAQIKSERVFLTEEQQSKVAALSEGKVPSALIVRYTARKEGGVVGRAYVDTHVVRTKRESLLICLNERGDLRRIEVTAFHEPPEYLAPPAWYAQYQGRKLDKDLTLQRAIRPIAGATLTARATNEAVRRVLAIDRALEAIR